MASRNSFTPLLSPYKWQLAAVVLVNILSTLFTIASLLLIEPLVEIIFQGNENQLSPIGNYLVSILHNWVDPGSSRGMLLAIIIFVIILYFLKNFFQYMSHWFFAPVRSGLIRDLRKNLYDKILILPLSYFTANRKGDILSRSVNDTQEIEFTIIKSLQQLLLEPISILIYLVALFWINYQLTLFVLILLPVAGLLIGLLSRSLRRRSLEAKNLLGRLISIVEESIQGLRVIKGFNAQEFSEETFEKYNADFARKQKKIYRYVDLASPLSEFLGVVVVMIILVFGGVKVMSGSSMLTAGLFISYIAIFVQVINPAKTIATAVSNYRRGMATLDRINNILTADEVILQKEDPMPVSQFEGSININNVTFSYDHTEVLRNINFSISKGEIVALVGHSGSGKSTLVDLLPRFYDVSYGEILIDGTNIKDFVIDDLRSLFGLVSQDIVLFNDTVFNNIAFGMKNVTEEQVYEAARIANAYDFIMQMPDGFQTNIGDRGLNLSGGQRQRISIARAVLKNAPILILDEATSAMDTESEKLVQNALDKIMKNRTTLVIAHRLSTIRHADNILLIEDGQIVESGTHEQLMDLNGKYARLVEINSYRADVKE